MNSIRTQLISFFKEIAPESYHIEDAAYILHIKGADALNNCIKIARQLANEGILCTTNYQVYSFGTAYEEFEGIYKAYRSTYGFVLMENGVEDIYISESNRYKAMHNDKVLVRLLSNSPSTNHHREGMIVKILEHANETIVGTYDRLLKCGFVTPIDERLGDDIYIDLSNALDARSGAKVLVKITQWPTETKKAEGKIIEILGYKGDIGLDISLIMANHHIPSSFPAEVIDESSAISKSVDYNQSRMDLRDELVITIDGEDAKDLDDAVSAKRLDNGHFELSVHIADVSHYVTSRSAIDQEAYNRGTSVYLVDRVVPMLPEILSNDICSLQAHEDRNTMTCIMEINTHGKVVNYKIVPSIINVGRRCNYKEVYKAITQQIIPDDLAPFMDMIRLLHEISKILKAMRKKSGALDFNFPEYKVLLDTDGTPLRIVKRERTLAEELIEQCMLLANETVASHLEKTQHTSIYRIHEKPSEEKLNQLQTVTHYLGASTTFDANTITPKAIQEFLNYSNGTDFEAVAQIMTLRSMQQAKYSTENKGHFGLASSCYTHFTSPIRRYPDLMVHRLLKANLHWSSGYTKRDYNEQFLMKAAEHASKQEQIAVAAERDAEDLKKTEYMVPFIGDTFIGKVSSITSFGMFVELENGIDGLVHINMMNDDYYFYEEEHFVLVGKRTGKIYRLGQEVEVTLIKADIEKKQIDFVLGKVDNLRSLQNQLEKNANGNSKKSDYTCKKKEIHKTHHTKHKKKIDRTSASHHHKTSNKYKSISNISSNLENSELYNDMEEYYIKKLHYKDKNYRKKLGKKKHKTRCTKKKHI